MQKEMKLSFDKKMLRLNSNMNVLDVNTLTGKKIFVEMTGLEKATSGKGNDYIKLLSQIDGKETVFFSNLLNAIVVTPKEYAIIKGRGKAMDGMEVDAYVLTDEERMQRLHETICTDSVNDEGDTITEIDLTKLSGNSFEIVGIATYFRQDDKEVNIEGHPAMPLRNYAQYNAALLSAKAIDPSVEYIGFDQLYDFCGGTPAMSTKTKVKDANNWSYQYIIISDSENAEAAE